MVQIATSNPAAGLSGWQARRARLPASFCSALEACRQAPELRQEECAGTLQLLELLGCDEATLAAALWYELARMAPGVWQLHKPSLPEEVRRLVAGQVAAEQVWTLHAERHPGGGSEGLRRLLLAIIRDLKVVFILLARQLARLRAAAQYSPEEVQVMAGQTADIHAPLANRLGIWQLKWELEDLAFRYQQPAVYRRIARLLDERRSDRERFIEVSLSELEQALQAANISADLAGRPKHIYSIWKKMQRKALDFSDLYDIRAVRILVDDVAACYAALGVVHGLWPHLPGEFDDYIARSKGNGYQSLHTAVLGPQGKILEVQIRTHQMHRDNELGVAAHWRYKEGGAGDADFEAKIAWMRKLLEEREDEPALVAERSTELWEDRVYLLTPKGEILDLPRSATVLDFAYLVHTEVGHRCRGAKVNGRIVPLTFQPHSGDRVEILTAKQAEPSRNWLSAHHGYLNTSRAREKVRAWFRRSSYEANQAAGRAIFERELKRLVLAEPDIDKLLTQFHLKTQDELLLALALGEVTAGQLARALQEPEPVAEPEISQSGHQMTARPPQLGRNALVIDGVGNLMTSLARCCQPLPGDPVTGFITRGRGVSVHRADCPSVTRLIQRLPERQVAIHWGQSVAHQYEVDIELRGYDRKGLQKDVTQVISHASINIVASSSRTFTRSGEVEMRFTLQVQGYEQLSGLLGKLEMLPNVVEARRIRSA